MCKYFHYCLTLYGIRRTVSDRRGGNVTIIGMCVCVYTLVSSCQSSLLYLYKDLWSPDNSFSLPTSAQWLTFLGFSHLLCCGYWHDIDVQSLAWQIDAILTWSGFYSHRKWMSWWASSLSWYAIISWWFHCVEAACDSIVVSTTCSCHECIAEEIRFHVAWCCVCRDGYYCAQTILSGDDHFNEHVHLLAKPCNAQFYH